MPELVTSPKTKLLYRRVARKQWRKDVLYWIKDIRFRRSVAGLTAEQLWPLSLGYSPYSGMIALTKPKWVFE